MPLTVEIVTAERVVRTEPGVDVLIAPGAEGQLAILPKHAALMTTLDAGEIATLNNGPANAKNCRCLSSFGSCSATPRRESSLPFEDNEADGPSDKPGIGRAVRT